MSTVYCPLSCPCCDSNKVIDQLSYDDEGRIDEIWYFCEVCDFHGSEDEFKTEEF